ncbi:MAG: glycosyltransferase family 4 protein [Thermodesulfobacteriota bacterium]
MKIWYLSAYDQPKGRSSRTYDFSRELVKRGHRVTLLTNSYCHFSHVERLGRDERWRIEEIDGIRVVWLKTIHYKGNGWKRAANMLSNAWRAAEVARTLPDRPDVVIGPSVPLGTGWIASKIARMKRAAFVFEVRDIWPQALVDLGMLADKSLPYRTFRSLEKYLYRRAERISAVLPLTWKHIAGSGGDSNKVMWIPNGADLNRFSGQRPYDGGRRPLSAMYVGGFSRTHDVSTILKAARILDERAGGEFRFTIIGHGLGRSTCEHEARRLRLRNVDFRDPVPKSEIPELQSSADVLIASVKDTPVYQFGINSNKIYDYLASARPIIFSGNAPNDPIAESGAGFSIPPQDPSAMAGALLRFLEMRPEERVEMGKRGRRYVETEFDMGRLAVRMESLLTQAIQHKES